MRGGPRDFPAPPFQLEESDIRTGDIISGGPTAHTTHIAPNPPASIFYRLGLFE